MSDASADLSAAFPNVILMVDHDACIVMGGVLVKNHTHTKGVTQCPA